MLIKAGRAIERASAAEGGTHRARQALVATNGLVLAGVRQGGHPLAYLAGDVYPLQRERRTSRTRVPGPRAPPPTLGDSRNGSTAGGSLGVGSGGRWRRRGPNPDGDSRPEG